MMQKPQLLNTKKMFMKNSGLLVFYHQTRCHGTAQYSYNEIIFSVPKAFLMEIVCDYC